MLPFEEAFQTVLDSARQLGTERVGIEQATNRILGEDVKSDIDIPPFNKAAMDGYACRREDLSYELEIIETIPAGCTPEKEIGPKQSSKIMTGSVVPHGADCVIMKEYVEMRRENTIRFVGKETADNICQKGEDVRAGDVVLRKGTLLRAQHIAVLASVGHNEPLVAKRPRVALIATGDELVEPASQPGPSQIRNSNSFQLYAQVENTGERIAVKPGRPTVFATSENTYCFGLPGNPVSSFVMFELLIKPFLYKMMGHDFKPAFTRARLDETIRRKKTERDSWLPVLFTQGRKIARINYHGSAHINALCEADGLLCMPAGVAEIKEGTSVAVRQI